MIREIAKAVPCVFCGRDAKRHSVRKKVLYTEYGETLLSASKHYCVFCRKHFTNPATQKHAPIRRNVSWGLIFKAIDLSSDQTLDKACSELRKQTGYDLRPTTLHDWVVSHEQLVQKYSEVQHIYGRKEKA